MLIPLNKMVKQYNMNITGVLHVGAHECEEQEFYLNEKINPNNIHWIEAMQDKVDLMSMSNPLLNIYQAVISDKNNETVEFKITNNGQSSSILDLGTHEKHHPHVHVTDTVKLKTTKLDTFISNKNINMNHVNFLNLDIQGAELLALKSMVENLKHIKYIYTEVNTEKVYKNCALISEIDVFLKQHGFERKCEAIYKQYGWGDALYIKS
tara:strand:- start:2977 stop:3603 length:627 start_codon:yes stop_codon:yes gene_type:complete